MGHQTTETTVEPWRDLVRQKVESIHFGHVQIVVHEDRVTLIESTEKIRFSNDSKSPPAKRRSRLSHV